MICTYLYPFSATIVLQKTQVFRRAVLFALLNPQPNGAGFASMNKDLNYAYDFTGFSGIEICLRYLYSIAKESTGSTCTCQVQALPVNSQLTICQHEIARNYLQLGSKNLKNCK